MQIITGAAKAMIHAIELCGGSQPEPF